MIFPVTGKGTYTPTASAFPGSRLRVRKNSLPIVLPTEDSRVVRKQRHPMHTSGADGPFLPPWGMTRWETAIPLGLMRLLLFSPSPIEIIQTDNKMLQVFEWSWDLREIWTDGRDLSENVADEYLPRFNGYSVGNWEGGYLCCGDRRFRRPAVGGSTSDIR